MIKEFIMHSDKKNNTAASYALPTTQLTQPPISYGYWLQVYMIAAIISKFITAILGWQWRRYRFLGRLDQTTYQQGLP